MNKIYYRELTMCLYLKRDKKIGEMEITTMTNRNGLSEKEHLRLLNLNAPDYEYASIKTSYTVG